MPNPITFTTYSDEGDEIVHELPSRWDICSTCSGEGKSSAYLGAFTRDDIDEDPEFFEDYMHGKYDRPCDECRGLGRVAVVNEAHADPDVLARWHKHCEDEMEYRMMCEAERRMGA